MAQEAIGGLIHPAFSGGLILASSSEYVRHVLNWDTEKVALESV